MIAASDKRLPSGITVGEALFRAEKWWHEFRGLIPEQITKVEATRTSLSATSGLVLKVKEITQDRNVGNILIGAPWDDLTTKEKLEVTKCWHNHVLLDGCDDGSMMVDPDSIARQ